MRIDTSTAPSRRTVLAGLLGGASAVVVGGPSGVRSGVRARMATRCTYGDDLSASKATRITSSGAGAIAGASSADGGVGVAGLATGPDGTGVYGEATAEAGLTRAWPDERK